jgi:hypothetical protein
MSAGATPNKFELVLFYIVYYPLSTIHSPSSCYISIFFLNDIINGNKKQQTNPKLG